jgi:hypothetical protein
MTVTSAPYSPEARMSRQELILALEDPDAAQFPHVLGKGQ